MKRNPAFGKGHAVVRASFLKTEGGIAAIGLILLILFMLLLLPVFPAQAIDPGYAKGVVRVANETVTLTHAYAQLHDNAEGLLDRSKQMRIVVADREVRQDALNGLAFLPVMAVAGEGALRGLLITFDPKDPAHALVTLLYPPAEPAASLITQARTSRSGVINDLRISQNRISGKIEDREQRESGSSDLPSLTYAVSFSAPLFHEPKVTEDLKGPAVGKSPQIKVLRAAAAALKEGDFEALRQLSTDRANRRRGVMFAQTGGQGAGIAGEAAKATADAIDKARRVVVRGNRAVVIFPDKSWNNLERVGGEWKIDD